MPKDAHAKHSHSSRSTGHSKSHKESTQNGNHHRQHHGGRHDGASAPLSFLFVVNEVRATQQTLDSWGSKCPPEDAAGYSPEVASSVMRYDNGSVQIDNRYQWHRDSTGTPGGIGWWDADAQWNLTEMYATATVFSCHPLMPIAMVDTDATAENTIHRGSDSSYHENADDQHVWQPLLFFHPASEHLRGVSQVVFQSQMTADLHGGSPVKYVAGRGQLMRSLTPETYRYPGEHPPNSKGLGGNLAALLGLMAFHSPPVEQGRNRAETGIPGKWQGNRWRDERSPRGYLRDDNSLPSGFVTHVSLDPENPAGSTFETLNYFEFQNIPIRE